MKTYTFSNGLSVTGTAEQILEVAAKIGEAVDATALGIIPAGFYVSSDGEMKKISEMHTQYIVNALLKKTIEHYESIRIKRIKEDSELPKFLEGYVNLVANPQIEQLFNELQRRSEEI